MCWIEEVQFYLIGQELTGWFRDFILLELQLSPAAGGKAISVWHIQRNNNVRGGKTRRSREDSSPRLSSAAEDRKQRVSVTQSQLLPQTSRKDLLTAAVLGPVLLNSVLPAESRWGLESLRNSCLRHQEPFPTGPFLRTGLWGTATSPVGSCPSGTAPNTPDSWPIEPAKPENKSIHQDPDQPTENRVEQSEKKRTCGFL